MKAYPLQYAFGLAFSSERLFDELSQATVSAPDRQVAIKWGVTPSCLAQARTSKGLYQATEDAFLLSVPSVARYHVTADAITVTPAPAAGDDAVRLFLFGAAVGALLHLNGILALHGSAVRLRGGGAAIFGGASTAGKSTLAAALGQRGYPALSDDIAAVHIDAAGQAWLHPGLARSKLWADALIYLNLSAQAGERVRSGLDKYALATEAWQKPERLTHVCEIDPCELGQVLLEPVRGLEKVQLLDRQTYRRRYVDAIGTRAAHMARLGQLAPTVQSHRIVRPRGRSTIAEIIELLERTWV